MISLFAGLLGCATDDVTDSTTAAVDGTSVGFMEPCTSNVDCLSNRCVNYGFPNGSFCSHTCSISLNDCEAPSRGCSPGGICSYPGNWRTGLPAGRTHFAQQSSTCRIPGTGVVIRPAQTLSGYWVDVGIPSDPTEASRDGGTVWLDGTWSWSRTFRTLASQPESEHLVGTINGATMTVDYWYSGFQSRSCPSQTFVIQ